MKKKLANLNFPENYSPASKSDVLNFLKNIYNDKSNMLFCENGFKKCFPQLYQELMLIEFPDDFKFSQKLYHFLENDFQLKLGHCKTCDKKTRFKTFTLGYNKYCCSQCAYLNDDWHFKGEMTDEKRFKAKEKRENTNLEKYGEKTPNQFTNQEIHKTWKSNIISKYSSMDNFYDENLKSTEAAVESKYGVRNVFLLNDFQSKGRKTKFHLYGDEFFNNRELALKTFNEKYGSDSFLGSQAYRDHCIKKYGVANFSKSNVWRSAIETTWKNMDLKRKNEISTKHSLDAKLFWNDMSPEAKSQILTKIYLTKKKNNSFNSCKSTEGLFAIYLSENKIDFVSQFKNDLYPYLCDFYLPQFNLYIEIQGFWTHNDHPFNPNDPIDLKQLDIWREKSLTSKKYKTAIDVWTVKDPEKRQCAQKNGLNFLEIFSHDINEIIKKFEEKMKELS